jgi:hypothetical protein
MQGHFIAKNENMCYVFLFEQNDPTLAPMRRRSHTARRLAQNLPRGKNFYLNRP